MHLNMEKVDIRESVKTFLILKGSRFFLSPKASTCTIISYEFLAWITYQLTLSRYLNNSFRFYYIKRISREKAILIMSRPSMNLYYQTILNSKFSGKKAWISPHICSKHGSVRPPMRVCNKQPGKISTLKYFWRRAFSFGHFNNFISLQSWQNYQYH